MIIITGKLILKAVILFMLRTGKSAKNGRIVFAKVKSKLNTGYINNKMLVEANINVIPVFSVIALGFMFIITFRKIYNIINRQNCI